MKQSLNQYTNTRQCGMHNTKDAASACLTPKGTQFDFFCHRNVSPYLFCREMDLQQRRSYTDTIKNMIC